MSQTINVPRELLERVIGEGAGTSLNAMRELRAILAAPRQPEGEGLEGLLADVKADYTHAIHWEDLHATMKRIDAALAEVKPCPESPHPAAT